MDGYVGSAVACMVRVLTIFRFSRSVYLLRNAEASFFVAVVLAFICLCLFVEQPQPEDQVMSPGA